MNNKWTEEEKGYFGEPFPFLDAAGEDGRIMNVEKARIVNSLSHSSPRTKFKSFMHQQKSRKGELSWMFQTEKVELEQSFTLDWEFQENLKLENPKRAKIESCDHKNMDSIWTSQKRIQNHSGTFAENVPNGNGSFFGWFWCENKTDFTWNLSFSNTNTFPFSSSSIIHHNHKHPFHMYSHTHVNMKNEQATIGVEVVEEATSSPQSSRK